MASRNSIPLHTYNLVASQHPRAAMRWLPDTRGNVEIAQPVARILTAQAGARGEGAGTVSGPLNSPLENSAARIGCPVAIEKSGPDLQQRTARAQGDSNCLQAVDSSNSANDAHTGNTMQNLHSVPGCQRTATDQKTDSALKCDVELVRIAVGLKQSPLMRLWIVLSEMNRDTGLQGHTRAAFDAALLSYGVKGCDAYTSRLLRRGHGLYWNLANGIIYPCGYVTLCKRLTEHAHSFALDNLFATNGAGARKSMYIDISGSTADFEGAVLASWYASKSNPIISRAVLTLLFNRDAKTLRSLEARAGVQVVSNLAHTYDPSLVPLDDKGGWRWDVDTYTDSYGRTVYTFFMSNTYHAPRIRQHHRWGQLRRASALLDNLTETFELHLSGHETGDEPVKLKHNRSLMYFENARSARTNAKKYGDAPRYVYLGQDDNRAMFELSRDGRAGLEYWDAVGGINALV